ncbi:MAG: YicC family protein [Crocinitomicaceae bacterium]|nr:YicC family protein [Crocinitomicaceae bacterium]
MLKSMTGFGKATGNFQSKKVSVEIRSLNSKSCDLNTRIAQQYKEVEPAVRKLLSQELNRGKIDVSISIDSIGEEKSISINKELGKEYYKELKELNDLIGEDTKDYLALILRMPEILNNNKDTLSDEEKKWVKDLVKEASDQLNDFRRKEGEELQKEFGLRIDEIRSLLNDIPKFENERVDVIRERMKKGLEEISSGSYDDNRFEQEMIFYLEKLDVSEEKMRLSNHLDYFEKTMKLENSGKKLGFISQEIGREINTLGSKSNHAQMQTLVIGMKDGLEKIKEQILNTL